MIVSKSVEAIRFKARATEESLPSDELLILMQLKQYMVAGDLEYLDEGYEGDVKEADLMATGTGYTTNLSGDKVFTREYAFPAEILARMKFVDAKLDGEHWIRLKDKNMNMEETPMEEVNILEKYSNEQGDAGYGRFRGSMFLLTGEIKANITNGMKLFLFKAPTLITDLSASVDLGTFGIPYQLQESYMDLVVAEWKANHDKPLSDNDKNVIARYTEVLDKLKNFNRDQEIVGEIPSDNTDNGYEN